MRVEATQIRGFRLRAHHLDRVGMSKDLQAVAGACGLQNSPPGAWETAAFNRSHCTLAQLHDALYRQKNLLQAWSYRGVPVVFPTRESAVFLSALIARPDEQPWIYTRGIALAQEAVQMPFEELFARVSQAAEYLRTHTVTSKEALDQVLADLVCETLSPQQRALWNAPSMYGRPDRQTVGGAVVSFLLRPCSFEGKVVFGQRQGTHPTFTSFAHWTGQALQPCPQAQRELVRRFLHCYGPSTRTALMQWLGCSPQQAKRMWNAVQPELEPVEVEGKRRYLLAEDLDALRAADGSGQGLRLLGAHDPYLDLRDREIVLPDTRRQRAVWKTVANPGAIVRDGRIIGTWKSRTVRGTMSIAMAVWETLTRGERAALGDLAQAYAAFRERALQACSFEDTP